MSLWSRAARVLKHLWSSECSGQTKVKRCCPPSMAGTEACYLSDTDCGSVGDYPAVDLLHCRSSVDQLMLLKLGRSRSGLFLEKYTVRPK